MVSIKQISEPWGRWATKRIPKCTLMSLANNRDVWLHNVIWTRLLNNKKTMSGVKNLKVTQCKASVFFHSFPLYQSMNWMSFEHSGQWICFGLLSRGSGFIYRLCEATTVGSLSNTCRLSNKMGYPKKLFNCNTQNV